MFKSNVKLMCDGIANMPKELVKEYDIDLVPITIRIDEEEFKDTDISNEDFYKLIRESEEIPKTSQATYIDFRERFEKYTNEGKSVLYIAGSSKSSGTYQSAVIASRDVDGDIYIIDSMSICFGCGMLVLQAARMLQKGCELEYVVGEIERLKNDVFVGMSLNSLEYLKKGGRISNTKALVGNILSLRPLLTVKDGLIYQEGQIRGNKRIIPSIINRAKEVCGDDFSQKTVAIGCGDNIEDREKLKEAVINELNPKEIIEITVNPPICINSGPGFIGLTCLK